LGPGKETDKNDFLLFVSRVKKIIFWLQILPKTFDKIFFVFFGTRFKKLKILVTKSLEKNFENYASCFLEPDSKNIKIGYKNLTFVSQSACHTNLRFANAQKQSEDFPQQRENGQRYSRIEKLLTLNY
jgi:hypothetical protein